MERTKKNQKWAGQKKHSSKEVHGVSLEAARDIALYGRKDLWKRKILSQEWYSKGVMDGANGELTEGEDVAGAGEVKWVGFNVPLNTL